tara:strand:- start:444 stop:1313 length:870 start_codon:yes stop_codon:yes gene_type:complete
MRFKLFFIASFFIQFSFAESFNFNSDSSNYLIGDHVKCTLSYEGSPNFIWPSFKDTLTQDLEVLSIEKIDTLAPGKYQQTIFITAWDSGYFVVPPIRSGTTQTAPYLIRFNTIAIDNQQDIKPVKEQMNTPFIFAEIKELILWIIFGLIVLTGIVILTIYLIRKRKPKPETILPPRPIMEILWERYYSLEQSKIWETGGEKEFQFELSLILRSFLEFKYNLKAVEETTKNITIQLTSMGIGKKEKEDFLHILNFSDMVKFAKQKGVFAQHENALAVLKKTLESQREEVG